MYPNSILLTMPIDFHKYTYKKFQLSGTHIPWETAPAIFRNIGKLLITHLDYREALSGIGLIRFKILQVLNNMMRSMLY